MAKNRPSSSTVVPKTKPYFVRNGEPYWAMPTVARCTGFRVSELREIMEHTRAGNYIDATVQIRERVGGYLYYFDKADIRLLAAFRKRYPDVNWDDPPDEMREVDLLTKQQSRYIDRCFNKTMKQEERERAKEKSP
jgi:hypothetical protein